MAAHSVSKSVYSIYVLYKCTDSNYNDQFFVVRHLYNMKTNSLSAPGKGDSTRLPRVSQYSLSDIKVFGRGKTEAGFVAIAEDNVRLYKLEGGKLKWRGVKSVTPVLNSTEGLGPSFGGAFDSRAAAISSPSSFYTLYRQGCWVPEGANHCVYTGNVYEEVWRTDKKSNRRIGGREESQVLIVGSLAIATDRTSNNNVLHKMTQGGSKMYDANTYASDGPIVLSASQTTLPSRGFKRIGTLPTDSQGDGSDLAAA